MDSTIEYSIIIPTCNRFNQLETAIQSVMVQSIDAIEIIVIDDASDATNQTKLLQLQCDNHKIIVIQNKYRMGAAAARNKGLEAAIGKQVLFLDDDDLLLPNMLHRSWLALEEGGCSIVSCRSQVISNNAQISPQRLKRYNWQSKADLDCYPMNLCPQAHILLYHPNIHTFVLLRKSIGKVRFNEQLTYGEDIRFWLALVAKGLQFRKLDFVGVVYSLHHYNTAIHTSTNVKLSFYNHLLSELKLPSYSFNLISTIQTVLLLRARDFRAVGALWGMMKRPVYAMKHIFHLLKRWN